MRAQNTAQRLRHADAHAGNGGAVLHAKAAAAGGAQELVTCIEILFGKSDSSYAMLTDLSCLKNAICSSSRS